MAGDKVTINVQSWYNLFPGQTVTNSTIATDLDNQLKTALTQGGILDANSTQTNTTAAATQFANNLPSNGTNPQAGVFWLLLNDQYQYVTQGQDYVAGNGCKTHTLTDIPATKNGYLFIYLGNNTQNLFTYFDNLNITHTHSPIVEETHYYPFGLTIAGISSKAANALKNKHKFNVGSKLENEEFSDGSGLEIYDFNARIYDAQIGRFMQMDPLADIAEGYSPYIYTNNNPTNFNDPSGLSDEKNPVKHDEVTVYPNWYRKNMQNLYNSYTRNDWELFAHRWRKSGKSDASLLDFGRNLDNNAQWLMKQGMSFDAFNTARHAMTRAGDKVFLQVTSSLIPVGRIAKWGLKSLGFVAKAANKPIVKSLISIGVNKTKNEIVGGVGNGVADMTSQMISGTMPWSSEYNWGSTAANIIARNPIYTGLVGAAYEKVIDPKSNFMKNWGANTLGDSFGNIPIMGNLKSGASDAMHNFVMPLFGNTLTNIANGSMLKDEE
jgi:RHS repeat-associated protein